MRLLRELNRDDGLTIVMVTHNLELTHETDRTIRLVDGQVDTVSPQFPDHSATDDAIAEPSSIAG